MVRTALTDAVTPNGQQPAGLAGFGDPVFSDEFQGSSLDPAKWVPWYPDVPFWNTTQPGGHKTNSNEPQGYDASGISFLGSVMRFTMRQSNAAVPELAYSSGMVSSGGLFSQAYGVFEAKIRTPDKTGAWAAFWLFPAANAWNYEIDVLEHWGRESFGNTVLTTVHPRDGSPAQSEDTQFSQDVGARFRTYTLWWEPNRIRVYIDGVKAFDRTSAQMTIHSQPMYPQLNLAGDRDKLAELAANVPFSMEVDYVRVWTNASGTETGPITPTEPEIIEPEEPEEPEPGTVAAVAPYTYSGQPMRIQHLVGGVLTDLEFD